LVNEKKVVRIERSAFIAMMATNSENASRRGDPNVLCLPLEFLPGWLFGIRFDSVMIWLQSWYEDLVNSGVDRS
jgi:hypothetical protein